MENLCHTLFGGALAKAGLDRLSTHATAALLIASNLPDADCVSLFGGNLAYVDFHRGSTHSLVGLAVQTVLLAGGLTAVDRAVPKLRRGRPPARFSGLLAASAIGLAGHLFLDYTNSYGVRPLLPFDGGWTYGDLVFVVDPWLWLLLGGALFLGASARRSITALWSGLFAVLAALVLSAWSHDPQAIGAAAFVWLAGLGALAVARWRAGPRDAVRLARFALATVVVYWLALFGLHRIALARLLDAAPAAGEPVVAMAALPTLMRPDQWRGVVETETTLTTADITVLGSPEVRGVTTAPRGLDTPEAEAALEACPGRVARDFGRFLFATVADDGHGGVTVTLRDARFENSRTAVGFGAIPVALDGSLRPAPDDRWCPR